MSDKNFSRRRRSFRFRPTGGLGHPSQRPDKDAQLARAEVLGELPVRDLSLIHI